MARARWPIAVLLAALLIGASPGRASRPSARTISRSQWQGALEWLPDIAEQVPQGTQDREDFILYLLRWIAIESGGDPGAIGSPREVGIFQIFFPDDQPRYGATRGGLRATGALDAAGRRLQVSAGIAMVVEAISRARARLASTGQSWSTQDLWALAKLYHNLPALYAWFPIAARGGNAASWHAFRSWLTGVTRQGAIALDRQAGYDPDRGQGAARYWPVDRFAANAERAAHGPIGS